MPSIIHHGSRRVFPMDVNTELVQVRREIFEDVKAAVSVFRDGDSAVWVNEHFAHLGWPNIWDWNRMRFITPRLEE